MKKEALLSKRDLDLIRNFLVGGVAVGGAAGLATSAVNHLNTLNKEKPSTSDDDDTLYLNMPKQAVIGGGVALAGGVLAGLGSYAAVRKIHQSIKRKRLQEQLDLAQQGYIDSIEGEASHEKGAAGKPMSSLEALASSPIALTLLLGLGSGVMAHKALDKAMPPTRKRLTKGPRRVLLRQPELEEDDPEVKEASYNVDDGIEFLLNLTLGAVKSSSHSDLPDLVYALTNGRAEELNCLSTAHGVTAMLSATKGASLDYCGDKRRALGISFSVKSAEFGPLVQLLTAAEFADNYPVFFKLAGQLSDKESEALAGVISALGAAGRYDVFNGHVSKSDTHLDKEASFNTGSILQSLLAQKDQVAPDEQLTDQQDTEMSTLQGERTEHGSESKDFIDSLLSGSDDERSDVVYSDEEQERSNDVQSTMQTQQA